MSFVDWDFLTPSGSTNFSTSAQINAGLSSPLLVGRTYARAVSLFGNFGSAGFYVQGTAAIKAAYQSGAFFNIPSTRAVRVQACLRLTNTVGSFSEFGLIAAGTKILNDGSSAAGSILTGYSIGEAWPTRFDLRIADRLMRDSIVVTLFGIPSCALL